MAFFKPFCHEMTVVVLGACFAIRWAISAVARDLTVTIIRSACDRQSGVADRVGLLAYITSFMSEKSMTVRPFWVISSMIRGRASRVTDLPEAASKPPVKQPMLPAPTMTIRLW